MGRLTAAFLAAFSRDLKKKAKRRKWDLAERERLIDLVIENAPESMEVLKRRHNMRRLEGGWAGRSECHVANSGDWLGDLVVRRQGGLFRTHRRPRRVVQVGEDSRDDAPGEVGCEDSIDLPARTAFQVSPFGFLRPLRSTMDRGPLRFLGRPACRLHAGREGC